MSEAIIESALQSTFRLKVTNISKLKRISSPIHVVQDIPWQVNVFVDNQKFGISLLCAISDTSQAWTRTASFSFQLVPFDGSTNVITRKSQPQAFNCNKKSISFPSILDWCELIDVNRHLVKDDAVQFDITIDAIDPNDMNQSILILENTAKCCENDCLAEFKLTIVNVKNLMAVRSQQFLLRGLLWDFSIYKDHSAQLVVQFGLRTSSDKVSCRVRMTTKLNTTKKSFAPIGRVDIKTLKHSQMPLMQKLMNWEKLMDPQSGFVENDAITMQTEIKIDKPEYEDESGAIDVKKRATAATTTTTQVPLKMECAICLEAIEHQNLSCPPCGHVSCSACLSDTAEKRKICPTCSIAINESTLQRIFLPIVN